MNRFLIVLKRNTKLYINYIASIALYLIVAILLPGFGVGRHFTVLTMQMSLLGIMAIGQTFVIITGGIDLSVPWLVNSSAILFVLFSKIEALGIAGSMLVVLVYSIVVGLFNGIGVALLGIPAIIMTLGVNSILKGYILGTMRGFSKETVPQSFANICNGGIGLIPNLLLIWIVISAISVTVLHLMTYGRKLYVVGSNPTVAKFSGINSKYIIIIAYVIGGLTSGLGGILLAGRLGQTYLGMGEPYLFMVLSAVVLGGTPLSGGSGSYLGTISGTLLVVVLSGFLSAVKLPTYAQDIFYGIILFFGTIALSGNIVLKRKR
jgi:ribose transport system permease protein